MSAVSNSVMPASSAACTSRRVAVRSSRVPRLLQPSPTAETCRSVAPNFRCSIWLLRRIQQAARIAADDQLAVTRRNRQRLDARDAIEIAHVERIVAAEQHMIGADRGDQELERRCRMQDRIVKQ